jgi:hypothetical protein
MKSILIVLILLSLAGCGAPMDSPQACAFVREAEIPVTFETGVPIVDVRINGKPGRFVLDTGASTTTVTESSAERLSVARDSLYHASITAVGAMASGYVGNIGRLEMATARQTDMQALVLRRTVFTGMKVDGLLGADVLSKYDLDLDLSRRIVRLYQPRNCPSGPPDWPEAAVRLKRASTGNALPPNYVQVVLSGVELTAQIDTGSGRNVVASKYALGMASSEQERAADRKLTLQGAAPDRINVALHRFSSLVVGNETIRDPYLVVVPFVESVDVRNQMLLGEDYLRRHRVWISYASHAVWVAPVGSAPKP